VVFIIYNDLFSPIASPDSKLFIFTGSKNKKNQKKNKTKKPNFAGRRNKASHWCISAVFPRDWPGDEISQLVSTVLFYKRCCYAWYVAAITSTLRQT